MAYYRYEFIPKNGDKDKHLGILTELEAIFDDLWGVPGWGYIEDGLKAPDCDMENTISYFTEKGNRRFRKGLRELCKAINNSGKGTTERIVIETIDPETILYKDQYQVILRRQLLK